MTKYLICVDSTPYSIGLYDKALDFFKANDYVYILHIAKEIVPLELSTFGDVLTSYDDMKDYKELNDAYFSEGQEMLRLCGKKLTEREIQHSCILAKGKAPEKICEEAKKLNVDVLIIGRRKMGLVGRALIGSSSDYISHNAPCTVLVLHS